MANQYEFIPKRTKNLTGSLTINYENAPNTKKFTVKKKIILSYNVIINI